MMQRNNVVPKKPPLTEEQFGASFRKMINRLIRQHGEAQVALWLGISVRHLGGNILRGTSLPTADKIWNLLAYDASAHEEMDEEFDVRKVPIDAVCDVDDLNVLIARALVVLNESRHPDSPGGRQVTHKEYLDGEEVMRALHAATGDWLQRCASIRTGGERPLRAVAK